MRRSRHLTCLLLICALTAPGFSQSVDTDEYVPYDPEEFSPWMRLLRRAEVVFIGSVPVTFLLTSLLYEGYRAAADAAAQLPVEQRSVFGTFDEQERTGLMIAGISLSTVIMAIDLIIELTLQASE